MYHGANERFVLESKENIAENMAKFSLKVMKKRSFVDGRHMASPFFFYSLFVSFFVIRSEYIRRKRVYIVQIEAAQLRLCVIHLFFSRSFAREETPFYFRYWFSSFSPTCALRNPLFGFFWNCSHYFHFDCFFFSPISWICFHWMAFNTTADRSHNLRWLHPKWWDSINSFGHCLLFQCK